MSRTCQQHIPYIYLLFPLIFLNSNLKTQNLLIKEIVYPFSSSINLQGTFLFYKLTFRKEWAKEIIPIYCRSTSIHSFKGNES